MDLRTKAYATLAFSVISGSFIPIVLALARGTNIFEFFFFVYLFSVPTGLALLAVKGKLHKLPELLRSRKTLLYISATAILSYLPLEFGVLYSEHFLTVSLTTAIFRTSPLLVLAFLPLMLREKLTKMQVIALVLGVVGLYVGVTGGNLLGLFSNANVSVIMLLVMFTFAYAFSIVCMRKFMFDTDLLIAVSAIVMFILFAFIFTLEGFPTNSMSVTDWLVIVLMGVYFNVISFYTYFMALKTVKVSITTNAYLFSPFLSFVWASVLLGEAIYPYYLVIAGLAALGIAIQRFDRTGGSYLTRKGSTIKHTVMFDVTGVFAGSAEVGAAGNISGGERVLAVKLHNDHKGNFESFMRSGSYENVYTDAHPKFGSESKYVKEIVGAGPNDFVVMKAGRMDDNEAFFEKLNMSIDLKPPSK